MEESSTILESLSWLDQVLNPEHSTTGPMGGTEFQTFFKVYAGQFENFGWGLLNL